MRLSTEQLQAFQRTLLALKTSIEKRLASSDKFGLDEEWSNESVGELSNYDNHPADTGTELFERGKDLALSEHTERELAEIQRSLEKIEDGTYGTCEQCGKAIPLERLEAHPTAQRCIEHSEDKTIANPRPLEEKTFNSPNALFTDDNRNTSFDAEDSWQAVARWGTSETPSDFFSHKKTNYNDMYMNADERIGAVESVENIMSNEQSEEVDRT